VSLPQFILEIYGAVMKKYNISFQLIETERTEIVEYPHLKSIVGIKDEIQSWLEDLGFEVGSFQISYEKWSSNETK